jgi:hypothetical protein
MRWCNDCGKRIEWMKENNKWIPLDPDGQDHRDTCIPDPKYIAKRKRLIKEDKI